jgi:hypothetical protein
MNPARIYSPYLALLCAAALLVGCSSAAEKFVPKTADQAAPAYDYPLNNPYAATVIGLPPEQKIDLTEFPEPDHETLTLFPDRDIPEGFWAEEELRYQQLLQRDAAPLVYVIAGTGGDARASKMQALAKILYAAGYHVVLLPSPTHPNFIINASTHYDSLRPIDAAPDLYRVMQLIDARVREDVGVTEHMITGYSLGAMNAAFTAALDEKEQKLKFSRVLLINPPYDLNNSINRIDRMLLSGMPGGMDDVDHFIEKLMARLGSLNQSSDALDFSNERLLLDAYEQDMLDTNSLATTIGLSFRLSAANMMFTRDAMRRDGYILPKEYEYSTNTDMDTIMAVALRTSFADIRNQYYQNGQANPQEDSLAYLANYMHNNPKFGLITNIDDVVLAPGEVEKLSALFAPHARLFNNGGHLGNMTHPAVAYSIVHFLRYGGEQP